MFKKILLTLLTIILVFILIVLLGPNKQFETIHYNTLFSIPGIEELDEYIAIHEAKFPLREDNQARIYWNDSIPQQTEYAIVNLHGFGASPMEASPFNIELAKKYGMNIYLARMNGHGSDEESMMLQISPQKMVDSALEAVEIGKKIGKKVILLTTSTGGTLSTGLMANDEEIFAAINHSPNYELADPTSHILLKPFGLQIARLVKGGKFHSWDPPKGAEQYWTINYRIEALQTLRTLINKLVTKENLSKIKQPVLIAGYYKDEENQDDVVSVKAMEEAYENLGTDATQKQFIKLPDVGAHVFTSPFFTKDLASARQVTEDFIENILSIEPIRNLELVE